MKLTRRDFGSFSAGLPLLASGVVASFPSDPDVVVVGAGVAGLAAAQSLIDGGQRVQVIEAAPRIGGRCFTDTASFGTPFDKGAAWLRQADQNPLSGFALLHRFKTALPYPKELLFAGGKLVSPAANPVYERAYDAVSLALAEAAEAESDTTGAMIVAPNVDAQTKAWIATVSAQIGALDMGIDLENLSVKDWFMRDEVEPSRLVREGLGTLVGRLGMGLPISVNTSARSIRVDAGGRAFVETNKGTLRTKAVIVTPSIGVLASGAISIDRSISQTLQRGLAGMQMGSMIKIALSYDQGSPATRYPENSIFLPQLADQRGFYFLVRPFGAPLVICISGGALALDLEAQTEKVRLEFARDNLRSLIGKNADRGLRFSESTNWSRNPLFLGCVAAARPGELQAREALAAPIAECIYLAGEALAEKAVQTAHGAYASGRQTARRVLSYLKRRQR